MGSYKNMNMSLSASFMMWDQVTTWTYYIMAMPQRVSVKKFLKITGHIPNEG